MYNHRFDPFVTRRKLISESTEYRKLPPCVIECSLAMPDDVVLCVDGFHYTTDSVGMFSKLGKFTIALNDAGRRQLFYMSQDKKDKKKTEAIPIRYTGFLTLASNVEGHKTKYLHELIDGEVQHITTSDYVAPTADFKDVRNLFAFSAKSSRH